MEKCFCPANRKLEKKNLLQVWGRQQHQKTQLGPGRRRGCSEELRCKWKCLLDLLTSAKMRGAKTVMKQEGSSTTTAEGARWREDDGTCLFSLQSHRQAGLALGKHWLTEETGSLHAGLGSPKRLLKTCVFRALSVSR